MVLACEVGEQCAASEMVVRGVASRSKCACVLPVSATRIDLKPSRTGTAAVPLPPPGACCLAHDTDHHQPA